MNIYIKKFIELCVFLIKHNRSIYNLFVKKTSYFKINDFFNTKISFKNPKPWLTLSCVRFLEEFLKLNPKSKILEIGGGNSTLFFLKNGYNVKTIESDDSFKNFLIQLLKIENLKNTFIKDPGEDVFDIIIIDSHNDRLKYLKKILKNLSKNGFVILDDSERYDLKNLEIKNLKEITFYGLKKESLMENQTKILFFNDVFLKI